MYAAVEVNDHLESQGFFASVRGTWNPMIRKKATEWHCAQQGGAGEGRACQAFPLVPRYLPILVVVLAKASFNAKVPLLRQGIASNSYYL